MLFPQANDFGGDVGNQGVNVYGAGGDQSYKVRWEEKYDPAGNVDMASSDDSDLKMSLRLWRVTDGAWHIRRSSNRDESISSSSVEGWREER